MNNLQRKHLMRGLLSGQVAVLHRDARLLSVYFDAAEGYVLTDQPSPWYFDRFWGSPLPEPLVFQYSAFAGIFALMVVYAPASKWELFHVYSAV